MTDKDDRLEKQAKEAFDRSVDGLDAATLSRLNRARQAALDERARSTALWLRWAPATGVAAAVVIALVTLQGPGDSDIMPAASADLEILFGEESIEMLEELEFYSWLDAESAATESGDDS